MTTENTIPESQIRLPKNAYKVRCIKCEKTTSKKGDPMLVQTFEIIESAPITQDGERVQLDGVQIMNWAVMTEKSLPFFNQQRDALGMTKCNASNVKEVSPESYLGQTGAVIAVSESTEDKNDVTGEPIINPNTGKPVISWRKTVDKWLGR